MIRRATFEDLPNVWYIIRSNETNDMSSNLPEIPNFLTHELRTGTMLVDDVDGKIIGFGVLIERGSIAYLAELFVDHTMLGAGTGSQLLMQVIDTECNTLFTLASEDVSARALYARVGMTPTWTNFWVRVPSDRILKTKIDERLAIQPANPVDSQFVTMDATVSGRSREPDHQEWERLGAEAFWIERAGERIGYAYIQPKSKDAPYASESVTIGPVGALDPDDATDCVMATTAFAAPRAPMVRFAIPGPHPAFPQLLSLGGRITYQELFMANHPEFIDPRRYLGSENLF